MPRKTVRPEHIIDAALTLAGSRGWHAVSLADIAAEAGLGILQLYAVFRSKAAILEAFRRRVDEAALGSAADDGEPPRDRLFDMLMRRFDALKPHKAAIAAMARDAWSEPLAALCGAPSLRRSMRWMLEGCGVSSAGWSGEIRANLLLGIYLSVLRVWLVDDSADMMKTMAALDRRLRQSERWLGLTRGDRTKVSEAAASA
jgi:AcrR family transcriptional regulator